jgi:hypothetical protein
LAISTIWACDTESWRTRRVTSIEVWRVASSSRVGATLGAGVDEAEAMALVAEEDVLLDGEVGHEAELLVDHHDPGGLRLDRVAEGARGAGHHDLAGRRRVETADQLEERRLAGAVLAQDGVHLAGVDVDVDAVQDLDGSERHRQAAPLEQRAAAFGSVRSARCRRRSRLAFRANGSQVSSCL